MPLWLFSMRFWRICLRLLFCAAAPDAASSAGLTPLMLAASNGHEETVRLLLEPRRSIEQG